MWWYWQTLRGPLYICFLFDTCVRAMGMSPSDPAEQKEMHHVTLFHQ